MTALENNAPDVLIKLPKIWLYYFFKIFFQRGENPLYFNTVLEENNTSVLASTIGTLVILVTQA